MEPFRPDLIVPSLDSQALGSDTALSSAPSWSYLMSGVASCVYLDSFEALPVSLAGLALSSLQRLSPFYR